MTESNAGGRTMRDVHETLSGMQAKTDAATSGPWIAKDISDAVYSPDDDTGWWWLWQESKLPNYGGILESHDGDGEGAIGPAAIDDNRPGVQEHADAEFIAMSRTSMPALLSAVEKVLELHHPIPIVGTSICSDCSNPHPCPTVQTIQEALGGV